MSLVTLKTTSLQRVAVDVAKTTHVEVAHGDAREAVRFDPLVAVEERRDDVNTVRAEVVSHEDVESEELEEGVGDVDELGDDVERRQVVAMVTSTAHAAGARRN